VNVYRAGTEAASCHLHRCVPQFGR
jgi:hypothetical protein